MPILSCSLVNSEVGPFIFLKILSSGCFSGEQVLEVFGIHVEPSVLGDGSCCYHGDCACEWRSEYSAFLVHCCYVFENSWLAFLNSTP